MLSQRGFKLFEKNLVVIVRKKYDDIQFVASCSHLLKSDWQKRNSDKNEIWKMAPWPLIQVAIVVTTLDKKAGHAQN